MAETLTGLGPNKLTKQAQILAQLWQLEGNRFSFKNTIAVIDDNQIVGIMLAYPNQEMEKLAAPTVLQLLKIRKLPLLGYAITHLKIVKHLLRLKEGRNDEYHIGLLATLPTYRGQGLGTKLIETAVKNALKKGFKKISLTVKQDNMGAQRLYQRCGFKIVGTINEGPFHLYRMVKEI